MNYTVNSDGIMFREVSNVNSNALIEAERECLKLLKKIGKSSYDSYGGTKTTITFYIELTEEEVEACQNTVM